MNQLKENDMIQINAYLYWRQNDWEDQGKLIVSHYGPKIMEDGDNIFLRKITVEVVDFPLPTRQEIAEKKAEALRIARQELLAETELKVQEINEKINNLLALPAPTPHPC